MIDFVCNTGFGFELLLGVQNHHRSVELNIIVFDGFPESFDPDIVHGSSFFIHGDPDAFACLVLGSQGAGILGILIRVNLLFPMGEDGFF